VNPDIVYKVLYKQSKSKMASTTRKHIYLVVISYIAENSHFHFSVSTTFAMGKVQSYQRPVDATVIYACY